MDYDLSSTIKQDITANAKWIAIFNGNTITNLTSHGKTLKEIVVPFSIDGIAITSIGDYAFSRCYNLTSVTIPNSVTSIGDSAINRVWDF